MNCAQIQAELIDFQFGEVSNEKRTTLEAHLLGCPDCLRDYFALKRQIETAELEDAPSPRLHSKLRAAVAQVVGAPSPRAWKWWERPTAFAVASAAIFAALTMLYGVSTGPGRMPHSMEMARSEASPQR